MGTSLRAAGSAAGGNFRDEARVWKAVGLLLRIRAWGQGSKFPFNLLGGGRRGAGALGCGRRGAPGPQTARPHTTPPPARPRGVSMAAQSPGCAAELGQVTRGGASSLRNTVQPQMRHALNEDARSGFTPRPHPPETPWEAAEPLRTSLSSRKPDNNNNTCGSHARPQPPAPRGQRQGRLWERRPGHRNTYSMF